ncbi:Phosphotransferase enzyme family protein [Actinomadura rubteroloni]|uniref:Phosphotransferase enzyme family protein n=1 Tax=Actinomadura rubteroloni TaxID=1926885 RepID=A0A2P4UCX0_9ACTN|nr:phosphotransferase [Actinomadura rubteroloni]POM22894.1 Phosphotransferase enzyme family protein [Actinomadura rubteroloni]
MDIARLAALGRDAGGTGEPGVLYDRHGVLVVRVGAVVVKLHQADRETGPALARRLDAARALPGIALAPLGPPRYADGRAVTVWPYGEPVPPEAPPWTEAGRLLAALHRSPVPADAPPWGRPGRVARVVGRLAPGPETDVIRRAFATLPAWIRDDTAPPTAGRVLIHGDWHLGQMVRTETGWLLIDVEDLGVGDPAWDLARPAALYAAGVLAADAWTAFLDGYGPSPDTDLWAALDEPARALAIQIAATCVQSAREGDRDLDDAETAMVDACARIIRA